MGKKKFQSTEPYISKKSQHYPAPRNTRRLAAALLCILAALLVTLIVAALSGSMSREMTDKEAIAKLDDYREGNMVNLNAYLADRKFEATGGAGEYVYRCGDKIVFIQNYDDYVRIGNGKGTSQQYGLSSLNDIYVCRVAYLDDANQDVLLCDLNLSDEALAEIVRWSYR